jgi:hypothetical protein
MILTRSFPISCPDGDFFAAYEVSPHFLGVS